jgi:hypothetical protein
MVHSKLKRITKTTLLMSVSHKTMPFSMGPVTASFSRRRESELAMLKKIEIPFLMGTVTGCIRKSRGVDLGVTSCISKSNKVMVNKRALLTGASSPRCNRRSILVVLTSVALLTGAVSKIVPFLRGTKIALTRCIRKSTRVMQKSRTLLTSVSKKLRPFLRARSRKQVVGPKKSSVIRPLPLTSLSYQSSIS